MSQMPQFTYVGAAASRAFVAYHPAGDGEHAAVLICPPFGNDDLCTYRIRREWAQELANSGHPVARLDLPGTGNAPGGPDDEGLLDAWTVAVGNVAEWLRETSGRTRVVALGIGLGGMLATRAAGAGAAIDDLALWAVPTRGRRLVRELRALASLEASSETAAGRDDVPSDGALASAGFVLSGETQRAIETIDLAAVVLPHADGRRVLLLERDGIAVEKRLRDALTGQGAAVETAPGPGYGAFVAPPQDAQRPAEVVARVTSWLAAAPAGPAAPDAAAPAHAHAAPELTLTVDGVELRERPFTSPHPDGSAFAIATTPVAGETTKTVVLLNSGAQRHIGPNRMYVELARRWAARGVAVVRADVSGIGEAGGEGYGTTGDARFYDDAYVAQVHTLLDRLERDGLPRDFMLAGLCSGAYWSLHTALRDRRVRAALTVNPRVLFWVEGHSGVREVRNVRKLGSPQTWRRLRDGEIDPVARGKEIGEGALDAIQGLPARVRARRESGSEENRLERALNTLQASDTTLVTVFTDQEPLLDELREDGGLDRLRARPGSHVELVRGPLASHTLEPLALQRAVHGLLDAAIERELVRPRDAADFDPDQRAAHDALWSRDDLVGGYASRDLRPPEVMWLIRQRDTLAGRVLEIGCGGGRISGYLADVSSDFVAFDISPSMVEHCARAYPHGRFELGDLHDLSPYGDGSQDAIVASFAVIDVLNDLERKRALRELHRVLAPEGLLLFSTHNVAHAPFIPLQLRPSSRRPVGLARELVHLPRRLANRRKMVPMQRIEADYSILNDEGHDFAVLHYYIGIEQQERQLREAGFELLEVFDLEGRQVKPGETAPHCPELHYVARRAAA
ncbi:MAG TPA: alpha/beta fold hydrolase [Conexibacter sp.]|jgi:SAM-dependent methyltransferase/alpha-beta hydrolase superfamily lysophospholipase